MRIANRILVVVLLLLASTSVLAAGTAERHRYLVGTEGPSWTVEHPFREARPMRTFRHVRGFAVEMTEEEAAEMARRPGIRFVELDPERSIREATPAVPERARFHLQANAQQIPYGIGLTNAPMVWPYTRGAGVKVGVVDTGINTTHPDLVANYKGGWNFVADNANPEDDNGHGTHVAGTIAAADNTFGVVGVAPEVDLYALKILNAKGSGSGNALIQAVEWAIDNGINIINMSLGGPSASQLEREAFERSRAAGIVSVAASGNNYPERLTVDYPAAYPGVIAVGAIDNSRTIASFSQRGVEMELVGAGVEVLSTVFLGQAYLLSSDSLSTILTFPMDSSPTPASVSGLLVNSGFGASSDFPSQVSGNVALISRGDRTFKEKSQNAKNAGAVAAIIYNNVPGIFFGTLCSDDTIPCVPPNTPPNPILTVSASQEDGQTLLVHLGERVTLDLGTASDYGLNNGTSMATPHVAGVAALLKALDPLATENAIRTALQTTATDLGDSGFDTIYGYGIADANAAGRSLAPGRFTTQQPGPRRRGARRPGGGN